MAEAVAPQIKEIARIVEVGLGQNNWDDRPNGRLFASHRSQNTRMCLDGTVITSSDVQIGQFGTRISWNARDEMPGVSYQKTREMSAVLGAETGTVSVVKITKINSEETKRERLVVSDSPDRSYPYHYPYIDASIQQADLHETKTILQEMDEVVAPLRLRRTVSV